MGRTSEFGQVILMSVSELELDAKSRPGLKITKATHLSGFSNNVGARGLEPPCRETYGPEPYASANLATRPHSNEKADNEAAFLFECSGRESNPHGLTATKF